MTERKFDGGIVGGKGVKFSELVASLENITRPNEAVVNALKGEVIIPHKNLPNFINNTRESVKMTTPNRFKMVGEWTFEGKGKVLDVNKGVEFDGKLLFNTATPAIETNPENREDAKANLQLVKSEGGTMWEMIVLDGEDKPSSEKEIKELDEDHATKFVKFLVDLQDRMDAIDKKLAQLGK